jgi:hypothetical protein
MYSREKKGHGAALYTASPSNRWISQCAYEIIIPKPDSSSRGGWSTPSCPK